MEKGKETMIGNLPWFAITRLERHYECGYCKEREIRESWAIIFFKMIITVPFTTRTSYEAMLSEDFLGAKKP